VIEKWKKISWHEDYEVSNTGKVRSWRPQGNSRLRPKLARELSQWHLNGYFAVSLSVNQKMKNFTVHSLVAEAFLGPKPEGFIVCHIDDNRINNLVSNLKYGTYSENGKDAIKNKKLKSGESHPNAKLSDLDVDTIRHLVVSLGKTHREVADIFGVARSTISGIINSGRRQRVNK
jgi:hypothetical protein